MLEYQKKKLNILLCGNYDQNLNQIRQDCEKDKGFLIEKVENKEELSEAERLIYVEDILKENEYNILHYGLTSNKEMGNIYQRVYDLMIDKVDVILILLTNVGGVLFEHAMSVTLKLGFKTINFVREDEILTGMVTKGTFLEQDIKQVPYKNEKELRDLIIRELDTWRFNYSLREKVQKEFEQKAKKKKFYELLIEGVTELFKK